jgi:hypothetical protein
MTDESYNPRKPPTWPAAMEDKSPTIRTTPVGLEPDFLPDQAASYVAPQPLPRMSEHKTIDMVPVRLAPEINPRNALTQRLSPVPVRSQSPGLLLSGMAAALVLVALILGTLRLLGPASTSAPLPDAAAKQPAPPPLPKEPALTAAAAIQEPLIVQTAQAAESKKVLPTHSTPRKVAPSAAPAPKGREVWLE